MVYRQRRLYSRDFVSLFRFGRSARAEMVRKNTRLRNAALAAGDRRLEHQVQADMAVQQKRPRYRNLRLRARFESIARFKDDIFTTDHSALAEAMRCSVSGYGLIPQLERNRVPARRPLG